MRLPAEWEPQETVLFTFPNRDGDWGAGLHGASSALINAANLVNKVCPTLLIVSDEAHFEHYRKGYDGDYVHLPTNDCWVRDYGPLTCQAAAGRIAKDFFFNGWGGKYPAKLDNRVTEALLSLPNHRLPYKKVDLELEGGAIDTNGEGAVLTTTKCLLNPNRHGGKMTKTVMEAHLRRELGADLIHWLHAGKLMGDDTDAHVDTLARFVGPNTIAYVTCSVEYDPHFASLKEMESELRQLKNQKGEPYELVPLPWPPGVYGMEPYRRLPATYANFLISNGSVFVPTYFDDHPDDSAGRKSDQAAIDVFTQLAVYQVIRVPSRSFIEQHGSLHCLTMQIPT